MFQGRLVFRGEYFSGLKFFSGEYFEMVDMNLVDTDVRHSGMDTDMVDTEVNVLQG